VNETIQITFRYSLSFILSFSLVSFSLKLVLVLCEFVRRSVSTVAACGCSVRRLLRLLQQQHVSSKNLSAYHVRERRPSQNNSVYAVCLKYSSSSSGRMQCAQSETAMKAQRRFSSERPFRPILRATLIDVPRWAT